MPAAAVIPAPLVYAKVAAVKKFVFGFMEQMLSPAILVCDSLSLLLETALRCRFLVTMRKLECSKQAYAAEHISMG